MQDTETKPKVSVCVVTFNQEKYIRQCLQSIVDQEVSFSFEVIVGDDGSTDGTRSILREFAERYPSIVKPIYNEKNIGPYRNYVSTHSVAKGDYVAHCDGDDFWYPGKLKYQAEYLDNNLHVAATFSNANTDGRIRNKTRECGLYRLEEILEKVFTKNICIHSSILERRAAINEIESEPFIFDFEAYWAKHHNSLIYIDPVVRVNYAKNPSGLTRQKNFMETLRPSLNRLRERGLNKETLKRMNFDYELLKYFSDPLNIERPSIGTAFQLKYRLEILCKLMAPKNIYQAIRVFRHSQLKPKTD